MSKYILAVDQGTTNSRAILFSHFAEPKGDHELSLTQSFPQNGWVEQDAYEMWQNTLNCCIEVLKKKNLFAKEISAIGISNQRETTILWDKKTGIPIYPAIVWQDRRTHNFCKNFSEKNTINFQYKTGLILDPYFSATKILWILENVKGARERALRGEILFGTVDTYLIWQFTKGKSHVTDATNASRTLLFNIRTQTWDQEILDAFNIPITLLPEVLDCNAHFGDTDESYFGKKIPITGCAGDQQAAAFGQALFSKGMVKSTYGTGCFVLLNTGDTIIQSSNQLLSTIAYRIQNKVVYGLEGSVFCAGASVKWLRDNLKLIQTASETETLAQSILDTDGVYFIPAFTGLGAPYWDPHARAAILGLTRNSGREHIVRAALEAVCYQTRELLDAMKFDGATISKLRVDGGMTANNWLLQFLSDILDLTIERPHCIETSALGAAFLAGFGAGIYQNLEEIASLWKNNNIYTPDMENGNREKLFSGWMQAIGTIVKN